MDLQTKGRIINLEKNLDVYRKLCDSQSIRIRKLEDAGADLAKLQKAQNAEIERLNARADNARDIRNSLKEFIDHHADQIKFHGEMLKYVDDRLQEISEKLIEIYYEVFPKRSAQDLRVAKQLAKLRKGSPRAKPTE